MRAVLEARPEVLWVVVRLLARRLRATDEALADAVFLDVPGRTAKRLLELAGDADEFQLPVTQEELAGMVGASRERVNKALALFFRLGWVEVDRPQPLPHPRPRSARAPREPVAELLVAAAATRSARRSRGSASTRAQASAASSARCAGRSASCTKPWSAPS